MNDDNPGRRGATKIDPGTAHHSGRSPEKLCLRHLAARANPCSALSALPGVLERSKVAFGSRHPGNLGMNAIEEEAPDLCITLVHGTWPRGIPVLRFFGRVLRFLRRAKRNPFWFEDGSLFRTELSSKLKDMGASYRFIVHEWSGANSILERAKAAKDLATLLCASSAKCRAAKQIVIAHSHGGNVIRLALEHLANPERIFVVTMGTPFIEINPSYFRRKAIRTLLLGLGTPLVAVTVYLADRLDSELVFWLGIAMTLVSLCIFYFGLVRRSSQIARMLIKATKGAMLWPESVKMLVIRAIYDEASLLLTAGTIGNRLSLTLALYTIPLLIRAMFIVSLLVLMLFFASLYHEETSAIVIDLLPVLPESVLISVTCLPAALVLVLGLLACAGKSFHGKEMFLGALYCEINSDSVPDHLGSSVWVSTLAGRPKIQKGRRHSIYNNFMCVPRVADAIQYVCLKPGRPGEDIGKSSQP